MKAKRRKATLSEAVAAELKSRFHVRSGGATSTLHLQQQQASPKSALHLQHQHNDESERATEAEKAPGDLAERGRVPSRSGSRLRRALAADTAPPVLGANCRLRFDLQTQVPPPAENNLPAGSALRQSSLTAASQLPSHSLMLKLRPVTSPATRSPPLTLHLSLATAAYAGAPFFVEPSPLAKRMSSRGISSASSGMRRRLHFKKRPLRKIPVTIEATATPYTRREETGSSTAVELDDHQTTDTRFVADDDDNDVPPVQTSNRSQQPSVPDEGEDDTYDNDTYEDDFMDESEPGGSSRLSDADKLDSDAELIDLLHDLPLQEVPVCRDENVADITTSSGCGRSEREITAALRIQRHVCGRNTRTERASVQDTKRSGPSKRDFATRERRTGGFGSSRHDPIALARLRITSAQTKQGLSKRYQIASARTPTAFGLSGATASQHGNSTADSSRREHLRLSLCSPTRKEGREQRKKPSSSSTPPSSSELRQSLNAPPSLHRPTARLLESLEQHEPSILTPADALKRIQTLYSQGLLLHKEHHTQQAIESYEAALRVPADGREFASLHINLGSARMAQLEFSAALASFERAERIDPANAKAAFNCALALLHLGRTAQAREQVCGARNCRSVH